MSPTRWKGTPRDDEPPPPPLESQGIVRGEQREIGNKHRGSSVNPSLMGCFRLHSHKRFIRNCPDDFPFSTDITLLVAPATFAKVNSSMPNSWYLCQHIVDCLILVDTWPSADLVTHLRRETRIELGPHSEFLASKKILLPVGTVPEFVEVGGNAIILKKRSPSLQYEVRSLAAVHSWRRHFGSPRRRPTPDPRHLLVLPIELYVWQPTRPARRNWTQTSALSSYCAVLVPSERHLLAPRICANNDSRLVTETPRSAGT